MRLRASTALVALLLAVGSTQAWGVAMPKVGRIDYIEGSVSLSRSGKVIEDPNIDDVLQSGDLIKTGGDGRLVIAFDKNTGMNGTLTVTSRTTLYVNVDTVKGQPKTSIELLAGSLGSKVSKISGAPTMSVQTGGAVMGVRGTEYEIAVSVNEAVLVTCVEGQVSCSDDKQEMPVPAGKVLEKRPGEAFRYVPVAISSIKDFKSKWIADEITAFRSNAVKALQDYEKRYNLYGAKFKADYEPFYRSPVLKKWMDEDKAGVKPRPLDAATMREKKEMAGHLVKLEKTLFIFERLYYRLDEIMGLVEGTELAKVQIRPNYTAGDLVQKIKGERDQLARNTALVRFAMALYAERDPDGEAFGGDDDFFGSDSDF